MAAATQVYQWEHMVGVAARGTCSQARMAALKILLDRRPAVQTRPIPPWINEGVQGQVVSLRFNSILPPQGLLSGGDAARDSIKEWILDLLIQAFPDLGTVL